MNSKNLLFCQKSELVDPEMNDSICSDKEIDRFENNEIIVDGGNIVYLSNGIQAGVYSDECWYRLVIIVKADVFIPKKPNYPA